MIIVQRDNFTVSCNGCGSGDDVMLVSAGMNHGHGGFLLCRNCRVELIEKLRSSIEKEDGGDGDG